MKYPNKQKDTSKKILIISHHFPPLNSIGALRIYSWAKYWAMSGHEITVLTTKKDALHGVLNLYLDTATAKAVRVEEVSSWPLTEKPVPARKGGNKHKGSETGQKKFAFRFIKYLLEKVRTFTGSILNPHNLWVLPWIKRGTEIYGKWPFDIIVSSYSPPSAHITAAVLSKRVGVFWTADYRDLWYGTHILPAKWPFSLIERGLETYFVKRANLITTVSDPLNQSLSHRFGKGRVVTIENGFDTHDLPAGTESVFPRDGKKRLVYTGTIHAGKRDPSPLFEAVNTLIKEGVSVEKRLEILFYGLNLGNLSALVDKYRMHSIVRTPGFAERKHILKVQKCSDALIFLEWSDPSAIGVLTGKLFEYMYAGTPILGIGIDAETTAGKLIEEAGVGILLGNSVEKIVTALKKILDGEALPYSPRKKVLERYTRERLAKKMLNEIINRF